MKQTTLSIALLSVLAVPAIAAEPDTEAVEFYHGPSVDTSLEINHTEIALPVRCWPAGA